MADPLFSNVSLLVPFDGTNGGTDAADLSDNAHTLTFGGNPPGARLTSSPVVFGTAALEIDNDSGQFVQIADDPSFTLDGDFTIEGWCRPTDANGFMYIISKMGGGGGLNSWALAMRNGAFIFAYSTNGNDFIEVNTSFIINNNFEFKFLTVCRDGNELTIWVDGVVRLYNGSFTPTIHTSAAVVRFAMRQNGSISQTGGGYYDEWRVTKGEANYPANTAFTPPSEPFPTPASSGAPIPEVTTRASQQLVQALAQSDTQVRASQTVLQVLGTVGVPLRQSQVFMQALSTTQIPLRISQQVVQTLAAAEPCITRRCQVWRIERQDGTVFRFTSHDEAVTFRGESYTPCDSLQSSASQAVATVGDASNMVLAGIIDDDAISEADIQGGLFDDAMVEVWLINWDGSENANTYRLAAGWLGQISSGENGFQGEIIGPGGKLAQKPLVQQYIPTCRWQFGDTRCGVDRGALARAGTVTQVQERGAFRADVADITGSAQYDGGTVNFLTGQNAGLSVDVKSVTEETGGSVSIVLWLNAPLLVTAGDTFELLPGCDQRKETCKSVYGNLVNFGGFDFVPGEDEIQKTPKAKY